jgi:hypothetical protein
MITRPSANQAQIDITVRTAFERVRADIGIEHTGAILGDSGRSRAVA